MNSPTQRTRTNVSSSPLYHPSSRPPVSSRSSTPLLAVLAVMVLLLLPGHAAWAATEVVTTIDPFSVSPTPGVWYANDIRNAGTATIESLVGLGGDLENAAPLPVGAVLLTTTSDNADKAEIGVPGDFGLVSDIIDGSFQLAYSYYKANNGSAFAAPSIKLVFFNFTSPCPSPSGDCFVTLVYEPTWNQPGFEGSSSAVPTDAWTDVAITNTSGLFWGTGGFGQPNTAGGPPLRTLDEWLTAFDSDFGGATLVTVSVGVGTFNQDQIGYFDDVSLVTTGPSPVDVTYDFEPPAAPPGGLFVDLYHSSQPASPVQAGYVGVDGADASDGTPVAVGSVLVGLASAGVQTGGTGLSGRDRGALNVAQPLSDLARDFAFAWGEELILTLDGLEAGIYDWTGYFHDNTVDQGDATVSLSVDGGVTFPFGPKAIDYSTTTNPPAVETQTIRFASDGVNPVVVRISNPDLPTPAVRPVLDGFDVVAATDLDGVFVDWYHSSQGVSPVQAGYVGANAADAADGSPISIGGLTLALASAGTESPPGGGVNGRDRGALDASQPLSDLARDFAFAFGEELVMTIGGVAKGTYLFTGYFHDSTVDQGDADVSLSVDGGSTFPYGPTTVASSTTTNPPEIATLSVLVQVTGEGSVVVKIANPDLPTPTVRPILDGFDLVLLQSDGLFIDFFDSTQGVSPVQAGYAAVDGVDASDGSPVSVGGIDVSIASGGVETGGAGTNGRDRGALAPGQIQSDLARDFVFAWGEDLLVTLDGVAAGPYLIIGTFHDNTVDQGLADISVSVDGGATFLYGPTAFTNSTGTDPNPIGKALVAIDANGIDPVVVKVSNPDLPTPSVRPIMNGLVMVPEPNFWLGLATGFGLLAGLARRRNGDPGRAPMRHDE